MRNVQPIANCFFVACTVFISSCATTSKTATTTDTVTASLAEIYYVRPTMLFRISQTPKDIRGFAKTVYRTTDPIIATRLAASLGRRCTHGIGHPEMDVRIVFDLLEHGVRKTWISDGSRLLNLADDVECELKINEVEVW